MKKRILIVTVSFVAGLGLATASASADPVASGSESAVTTQVVTSSATSVSVKPGAVKAGSVRALGWDW